MSIVRYVRKPRVLDYCKLGWIIVLNSEGLPPLQEAPHGEWSMLMAWLCPCKPREPA